MNAWSRLPNACHIDRVLESVKSHTEIWDAIWDEARLSSRYAALGAARYAAWNAAWGAITALIAYDDASKYLDMPSDHLRVWAILSEDPASVLLLPAVVAFERINELELV